MCVYVYVSEHMYNIYIGTNVCTHGVVNYVNT